jgi:hypothetical protein
MIVLNLKLWSWIIATIIFLVYNIFFNKEERGGDYSFDMGPLVKGAISIVLYLIFWIVWLILTR